MLGEGSSAGSSWGLFRNGWSPAVGLGFPSGSAGKESTCRAGDTGDSGSVPGLGRSSAVGNGNLLQCSCLENPMDRGNGRATAHGVIKNQTRQQLSTHARSCEPTGEHAVLPGAPWWRKGAVRTGPNAARTSPRGQGSPWTLAWEDQEPGRTVRVICSAWPFAELTQYLGMHLYIQSKDSEHVILCVLPVWQVKRYSFIWTGMPLFIKTCLSPRGLINHLVFSLLCTAFFRLFRALYWSSQSSSFTGSRQRYINFVNVSGTWKDSLCFYRQNLICQIYWYFIMWFGSSKSLFFIYLPSHELKMVNWSLHLLILIGFYHPL